MTIPCPLGLFHTLQHGRSRGRGEKPAVAPVAPVAGPSPAVPVHVCDEHDDDSEKENKPYEIEGPEVEEEEEEGILSGSVAY